MDSLATVSQERAREAQFPFGAKSLNLVDRSRAVVLHDYWTAVRDPDASSLLPRRASVPGTMWTTPAHHHAGQGQHGARAQTRSAKSNSENTSSRTRPAASQHQYTVSALEAENYADFLEPAVDGPPSPAVIRAFNDKVKQASVSERHVNQQPTSSGASSLISYAPKDRRPSWEQTMESFSLSRKSSVKSTSSSMPSKDRPESVQAIGKAIFNRKSKLRRESVTGGGGPSHSGELTPPEMPSDRGRATSVISKDHIKASMSIFSRRKTVQAGEAAQAKPMISSPYNFQHVTQIHRDQLPILEGGDTISSELAGIRTPPALSEDLHVPNFASGRTRPRDDEESVPPDVVLYNRENSISRPPSMHKSHPRQWIKQTKSQDHIRNAAPPRPPRSPTQLNLGYFDFAPPSAPPRHSYRPPVPRKDSEALPRRSIPRKDSEALPSRQLNAANFRLPPSRRQPGSATSSPAVSPGAPGLIVEERRFSHLFMPAETPDWPLSAPVHNNSISTFETALTGVPEEEEQSGPAPKTHLRAASNTSSLRGSISVPMLRKASISDASNASHDRTFSRDSVVLGALDMAAYRQSAEVDISNRAELVDSLRRDSWEAVIDYCYEHEMEADCDYDWHRPSLDMNQEPTVLVTDSGDDSTIMSRPPSDCIELPILSPSHHLSPQSSQEVITPNLSDRCKSPTRANFSLPRRERPQRLLHVRSESQVSFTEAQGFSLSPSFLIPTDYHQELLAAQTRKFDDAEMMSAQVDGCGADLFIAARASASTTASHSNLSSRSVFERHISATSTNTDYTRLTMSVSSVDLEGFNFKDEAAPGASSSTEEQQEDPEHETAANILSPTHSRSRSAAGLLGAAKSPKLSRDSHCSESHVASPPSPEVVAGGRARSKTLSATPGNFSLFPTVSKAPPRW